MKQLITITLIFTTSLAYSQKSECHINLDSIKTLITNPESDKFYDSLLVRFTSFDTSLNSTEYEYLYFGNYYFEGYSPYSKSKAEEKFTSLYKNKKYKKAIPFGEKALEENPINITLINRIAICYRELEMHELGKNYALIQYYPLLDAILNSCNSDSVFVVIDIDDEYRIMNDMEVNTKKQSLSGSTDIMTLEENKHGISKLYFDVSIPMTYLNNQFRNSK